MKVSSIHQVTASLCSIHHTTIYIPFITWQSPFHSPYDSPHSIHHGTVHILFIIKLRQFTLHSSYGCPLHSSYDCLYSLHSIHHMVVSALFITWQSLFYSSHASLRSIHHMPVSILFITWQSAPFIIIMTVLHPTNHFSAYHLVNRATLTMQHLLASGMCMNNVTFLCSLSLLITWWTMQHLLSIWHVHEEQILVLFSVYLLPGELCNTY